MQSSLCIASGVSCTHPPTSFVATPQPRVSRSDLETTSATVSMRCVGVCTCLFSLAAYCMTSFSVSVVMLKGDDAVYVMYTQKAVAADEHMSRPPLCVP
eukprot:539159-Rhodomonas_salina.2